MEEYVIAPGGHATSSIGEFRCTRGGSVVYSSGKDVLGPYAPLPDRGNHVTLTSYDLYFIKDGKNTRIRIEPLPAPR